MALTNKSGFTDERTRKKIDLHLRDINDEITETDIANVKTDVTVTGNGSDPEAERGADEILEKKRKEDKEDKTNDDDGNNTNSVETPWNVIG